MTHSPASAAAARPFWFFDWIRQPRAQILSLLTLVAAAAQWRFGILGGWPRVATALGVCVVTEFVLSWFVRGQIARL